MIKLIEFFSYRVVLGGTGKDVDPLLAPIVLDAIRNAAEKAGCDPKQIRDNHTAFLVEVNDTLSGQEYNSKVIAFTWSDNSLRIVDRLFAGAFNEAYPIMTHIWSKLQ